MLDKNALIDLHGGPAMVANIYLEGSYSELYRSVSQDVDGMRHLFRAVLVPGRRRERGGAGTHGVGG
jgi:xylulose-5-phosphate/fructose-6-phosphate phosphoketolase